MQGGCNLKLQSQDGIYTTRHCHIHHTMKIRVKIHHLLATPATHLPLLYRNLSSFGWITGIWQKNFFLICDVWGTWKFTKLLNVDLNYSPWWWFRVCLPLVSQRGLSVFWTSSVTQQTLHEGHVVGAYVRQSSMFGFQISDYNNNALEWANVF